MRVPLNWLKEYVDITIPLAQLAERLTFAGLEVNAIEYIGLPAPESLAGIHSSGTAVRPGLVWDSEKIVVAAITEVLPHPNGDRLVIITLNDGFSEYTAVTAAPNLFQYKGLGLLNKPIKVVLAKEGATIYDAYKPGKQLITITRAKISGVESHAVVCSERELGISDDHEGIIILDDDAPLRAPLADYLGDVVLDLDITPNMARNANILGVAREVAALTCQELRPPTYDFHAVGPSIKGQVRVEIREPTINPRFMAALISGVTIRPSPYWMQLRLRLALEQRPINNVVDITNYVMVETGQPLHAFDYDKLVKRAGGAAPQIVTRLPEPGEKLTTLDEVERQLDPFTVLVADTKGPLSLGGVIGGAETEVSDSTSNVLLESAAWEFINIRKTIAAQKLQSSQAGYRFSRGVHPAMAERGLKRASEIIRQLSGGQIANGVVDDYPLKPEPIVVDLNLSYVERILGFHLDTAEIVRSLERLDFEVSVVGSSDAREDQSAAGTTLRVIVPDHRLDIGTGLTGQVDLIEEIARVYGYDQIQETQMSDRMPPQRVNLSVENEDRIRDLLVTVGMQEVITYRLTMPEREARLSSDGSSKDNRPYVTLANPITTDRVAMRHSLLASVLEVAADNLRFSETLRLFEIGPVFLVNESQLLPDEPRRLVLVLTGPREPLSWEGSDRALMDFYDLKGVLDTVIDGLHLPTLSYKLVSQPSAHPGRCAQVRLYAQSNKHEPVPIGWIGELHPFVRRAYGLPDQPVIVGDLDIETLLTAIANRHVVRDVPDAPSVKEDLAFIVEETVTAAEVQAAITHAGGELLAAVNIFDIYRGDQVGADKKSLAFRLTYQALKRTLTDAEVAKLRAKIVKHLEATVGATLRG